MHKLTVSYIITSMFMTCLTCRQIAAQVGVATGEPKTYASVRTAGIIDANAPKIFEDVTSQTALKHFIEVGGDKAKNYILECTSGSVAILDYDHDGRLDLFVPAYVDFDLAKPPFSPADIGKNGMSARNFCQFRGEPVMCGPRGLPGARDRLFHQKSDGTFEDVSAKAGVSDPGKYYGFSSVFVDVNDDGYLDLLVINDS